MECAVRTLTNVTRAANTHLLVMPLITAGMPLHLAQPIPVWRNAGCCLAYSWAKLAPWRPTYAPWIPLRSGASSTLSLERCLLVLMADARLL
eukprot:4317323-Amphidinium_carterae.1